MEADDAHRFSIIGIFAHVVTDPFVPILCYDSCVGETSGVERSPQGFGICGVAGSFVPYTNIVYLDVVDIPGSFEPLKNVLRSQCGVREWGTTLLRASYPAWISPG